MKLFTVMKEALGLEEAEPKPSGLGPMLVDWIEDTISGLLRPAEETDLTDGRQLKTGFRRRGMLPLDVSLRPVVVS